MSTNEFGGRSIYIGLEKSAVAAARVVGGPPRCSKKEGKSVDVYKTPPKIIISSASEKTDPETAFTARVRLCGPQHVDFSMFREKLFLMPKTYFVIYNSN